LFVQGTAFAGCVQNAMEGEAGSTTAFVEAPIVPCCVTVLLKRTPCAAAVEASKKKRNATCTNRFIDALCAALLLRRNPSLERMGMADKDTGASRCECCCNRREAKLVKTKAFSFIIFQNSLLAKYRLLSKQ
jgi:hypothetical protein